MPDFTAAAFIDGLGNLNAANQRTMAATLLRLLRNHLARSERKLLVFAHEGFLYFCGFLPDSDLAGLADRLRLIAAKLRQEHGMPTTFGLCTRAAVATESGADMDFCQCARFAVVALRMQLHNEKGQVRIYNKPARDDSGILPAKLVDWLRQVVQTGRIDRVHGVCAELSDHLFGNVYIPLVKLRVLLYTLLVSMALVAQAAGVKAEIIHTLNRDYLTLLMAPYDYTQLRQILQEAVADFTAEVARVRLHEHEHPAVQAAEDYIRQHNKESLSLAVIAKAVGLSASYLSQLFHTYRGITITSFINHERVEAARYLLVDPGTSIAEAAFAAGFGSLQHFNRVFRATQGCTPTHYRNLKYVQNG